jgi:hypothetical protein
MNFIHSWPLGHRKFKKLLIDLEEDSGDLLRKTSTESPTDNKYEEKAIS